MPCNQMFLWSSDVVLYFLYNVNFKVTFEPTIFYIIEGGHIVNTSSLESSFLLEDATDDKVSGLQELKYLIRKQTLSERE